MFIIGILVCLALSGCEGDDELFREKEAMTVLTGKIRGLSKRHFEVDFGKMPGPDRPCSYKGCQETSAAYRSMGKSRDVFGEVLFP